MCVGVRGESHQGLGTEKEPQLVTAGPCGTRGASEVGPYGAEGKSVSQLFSFRFQVEVPIIPFVYLLQLYLQN